MRSAQILDVDFFFGGAVVIDVTGFGAVQTDQQFHERRLPPLRTGRRRRWSRHGRREMRYRAGAGDDADWC